MSSWAPPSAPPAGGDAQSVTKPSPTDGRTPPRDAAPRSARLADVRHGVACIVAVAGIGAVVALASRAGGLPGNADPGRPAQRELFPRVVLGAIVATAAALALAYLLHLRFAPRSRSGRRRRFGRTAALVAPLVALAGAFGALAGASTTPLRQRGAITRDAGFTLTVRPVDADEDGRADSEADGRAVLGIDLDGDGRIDRVLSACATPRLTVVAVEQAAQPGADRVQVPVDADCDGAVERIVYLDPRPAPLAPDAVRPNAGEQPLPVDLLNRGADRMRGTLAALAVAAVAALAGLVLVGLVLALRGTRLRPLDDDHPSLRIAAGETTVDRARAAVVLRESIDAMLTDADPRTGIIGAYARLLDGLADAGVPRSQEEAPLEHLQRCLDALEVPAAPLERLTELFVLARFSTHPMHEGHRLDALDALRAALGNLSEQPEPAGTRTRA